MVSNIPSEFKHNKAVGAILGAAYGDALGWPNERKYNSKVLNPGQGQLHEFKEWYRFTGGRFYPHEEFIEPGSYSDDTQLILCLSRSLLRKKNWFKYYTQVELPFWSLYERGGGGATKRAVSSWKDCIEPWNEKRKPNDIAKYFNAGGNGVAMRVLPHVLYLGDSNFEKVASSILIDGISTHGHPRALLGALVYGFALWKAIRKDTKLGYGELIDTIIQNEAIWSYKSTDCLSSDWKYQAKKHLNNYDKIWLSTKEEILNYLDICNTEFSRGSLIIDEDVLKKLQCYNRKISGAGSVAAVASIYLASRHAIDPLIGVINAAFSIGTDTDTVASMTGGLLGCIRGKDWLSNVENKIQDNKYLKETALKLCNHSLENIPNFVPLSRSILKDWSDKFLSDLKLNKVKLPDGRDSNISYGQDQIGKNGKYKVEFRRFCTSDGQTIYLKKISKGNFNNKSLDSEQNIQTNSNQDKIVGTSIK